MQTEQLLMGASNGGVDFLSEFPRISEYVQLLETRKEREKSREILKLLLEIARTFHRETLQQTVNVSDVYCMAVDNCVKLGRIAEAFQLCEEGLHIFNQHDTLQLSYGECLLRLECFEQAEKVLLGLKRHWSEASAGTTPSERLVCRLGAALGELYQNWGKLDISRQHFQTVLRCQQDAIPAYIGMVELSVLEGDLESAHHDIAHLLNRFGPVPQLVLTKANLALISGRSEEADELLAGLSGDLLGEDRFEYMLFQVDFFRGDLTSILCVPYRMTGASAETEAARVWLKHLRQQPWAEDSARIPKNVWQAEYLILEQAWKDIASGRFNANG